MSAQDWLVALDDAFCARLRCCTVCRRAGPGWVDIWVGRTHAVAILLCARCRDDDPERSALAGIMEQRYGHGGT